MGSARFFAFVCIIFSSVRVGVAQQRVIFVDSAAGVAGNGTSWTDALTNIPAALSLAESGDHIWVAAGSYRAGSTRSDTFQLKEGVQVFGGFAGNETPSAFALSQRDFVLNETLLDGDIGAAGTADNVFHVVTAANVTRAAVLDGFTIARGNASGLTLMQQDVGGGLLVVNASPTIRHCLIRDTQAGSRGGAVHVAGGSPYFAHCRFVGNRTTVTQGANNIGGAVYFAGTATNMSTPLFVNCLFVGNRAGVGNGGSGGAMYAGEHATATLVNCTLVHNRADTLTGGVFGSATIANSIFYGNQDRNGLEPTAQLRGAIIATHSLVQGGWPGLSNVNEDPLFRNPLGADGLAGTMDDDARVLAGSPCIDAGNNFAWPAESESADLDGAARFINDPTAPDSGLPPGSAMIDMGAYEKQSTCTSSVDCDDALFCNGEESCLSGVCQPGTSPNCTDNVPCTKDSCAEQDRACIHVPDDSLCDNGQFCDGLETCDPALGCVPGPAPNCNDAVECTIDTCDEDNRTCGHASDDESCNDGVFCNGREVCGSMGCMAGDAPCQPEFHCDEDLDRCLAPPVNCLTDADCDDANICTDDRCVLGVCDGIFNELPCDDANACTSNDVCQSGLCAGESIANCGTPPSNPGPGGTGPPTVDPPSVPQPDEDAPPEIDEAPDADSDATPEVPGASEPPASSPSAPCVRDDLCDSGSDDPLQTLDQDGDGVDDEADLCPSTPAGQRTDASGCGMEEPTPGRGTWVLDDSRRCGACGAMGGLGTVIMVCVPGTVLVRGRPRGRKFA